MNYIIRTRCPNGCKYKSGYTCVASECPYQTGNVRYDIRLNAEDKSTKINVQVKQAVKDFAEKLKEKARGLTLEGNKGAGFYIGNILLTNDIDELLKEI